MRFINKSWRWLVALGAVFVPAVALGSLTLPYTFVSGTAIKAAEVNANFTAVKTSVDGLDTTLANKIAVAEGFTDSWTGNDNGGQVVLAETTPVALTALSKVDVSAVGSAIFNESTNDDLLFYVCYRPASGTYDWNACLSGGFLQKMKFDTIPQRVSVQDVMQVTSAGSYVFSLVVTESIGGHQFTVDKARVVALVVN
jgi:hypothetical protein